MLNKLELTSLLADIAEGDLAEGSDLFDHPCSVAIRAINQCFTDIKELQFIARGNEQNKSKSLVRGVYNPSW